MLPTSAATRSSTLNIVFGQPAGLPSSQLPTFADVILAFDLMQCNLTIESRKSKLVDNRLVFTNLADHLISIWSTASIPTMNRKTVITKIQRYHGRYCKMIKFVAFKDQQSSWFKERLTIFKQEGAKLFDIAACQCIHDACICVSENHVPAIERPFLEDQRTNRKMRIAGIDELETSKQCQKRARLARQDLYKARQQQPCSTSSAALNVNTSTSDDDDCYVACTSSTPQKQMRVSLPSVAVQADRFGLSHRAVATIVSSTIQDLGLSSSLTVDHHKIMRERQSARTSLQKNDEVVHPVAIFFDGRKDKTLSFDNLNRRYDAVEEHVSVLSQPGGKYLDHITPTSGHPRSLCRALLDCCHDNDIDLDNFTAIGCDGTAVNTGHKGGTITEIEKAIGRDLQWFICLLHFNELPLRHLFIFLDGTTVGPTTFSGEIGKLLPFCKDMPLVEYVAIDDAHCKLPNLTDECVSDLSTDQRYLYDICRAVITGLCSEQLVNRNPGKMGHARWLTTANRLCRLYVATPSPSSALCTLAQFVVKVYAPMWFRVKISPSCTDGARHLHQFVLDTRCLQAPEREIVDSTIKRNAYFGHHENIWLAMLCDSRAEIRELASRRIVKTRTNSSETKTRVFMPPDMKSDSPDYHRMVDWTVEYGSPPILRNISDECLMSFWSVSGAASSQQCDATALLDELREVCQIPCHTQSVERCVKMVTAASKQVIGYKARDGWIRSSLHASKLLPKFNTKKDFSN